MRAATLPLLAVLSACTSTDDAGTAPLDSGEALNGLLPASVWGDENQRLDVAANGSATLAGGCAHATLDAAEVVHGAFDWTLAYTWEVEYADTGDHSYPVAWIGTISGDILEGTLDSGSGSTWTISLTRDVATDIGYCD